MKRTVYADHAATAPLRPEALAAMLPFFSDEFANPSSLHSPGERAAKAVRAARAEMAAVLDCAPGEVVFTSGGTESDNLALHSAAQAGRRAGRTHLIVSAVEHHAVLRAAEELQRQGFSLSVLPVDGDGRVSVEALRTALRPDTALVSIMTANNEIGTAQPIAALSRVCAAAGVPFHTDAVQAVGHLPLSFAALGCDYLSLSAHKFGGPKGVGALLVRKGAPFVPLLRGGAQERGRRAGTENVPGILGMSKALSCAAAEQEPESKRLAGLRKKLCRGIAEIPHVKLNGGGERLPGIVSVCFEGIEGESLLLMLDNEGICASAGSACASGSLEPSHVLTAIGVPPQLALGALRLSLGALTTEADIDRILQVLPPLVAHLREFSPLWAELCAGTKPHLA